MSTPRKKSPPVVRPSSRLFDFFVLGMVIGHCVAKNPRAIDIAFRRVAGHSKGAQR